MAIHRRPTAIRNRGWPSRPFRCSTISTRTRSNSSSTIPTNSAEPTVLPAKFPNLLVNGSGGIAVGMATNMAPHNLGEVIDACIATIDNPAISIDDLIEHHSGAGFSDRRHHPGTRRHQVGVSHRARLDRHARRESTPRRLRKDREALIVTEIPYQVNKAHDDREHCRNGAGQEDRRHLRHPRRERSRRACAS